MVGRLVEHQQVRLLHEQPRQVRAHDPAAAHLAGRPVEIPFAEAKAGKDLLGLGLQLVAAQLVEPVMDVVVDVLRVQGLRRMVGVPGLDDAPQLREIRRDGRGQFDHRFVRHGRGFLRQIADGNAPLAGSYAVIRLLIAQDDGEERGLPRAIRADQPDAVLAVHLQGGVGEQYPSAVRLPDAGKS